MPVHRMPGGTKSTVFAFVSELEIWASGQVGLDEDGETDRLAEPDGVDEALPVDRGTPVPGRPVPGRPWKAIAIASLAAVLGGVTWMALPGADPLAVAGIPSDPHAAAQYLEARDLWASREPDSLRQAITLLQDVTAREPDNALGWAGLAEAYLLAREFAGMPDERAFPAAEKAAERALRLDPNLAAGHRSRGFVHYWWMNDPVRAGREFRRAIELEPRNAQTHFWYGNVLSDNGQHALGLKELNTARLLEPGSVEIQNDIAYARWSAGDEVAARESLNRIAQTRPDFAGVHDCLSVVKLADGDYVGFVQELGEYARTSKDAELASFVRELEVALAVSVEAVQSHLIARALHELQSGRRRNHSWPVFLASVAQDRARVVSLLKAADTRREIWGSAGRSARIDTLWKGDAEIAALLRRRMPPPAI